jgi:hypothetical protein
MNAFDLIFNNAPWNWLILAGILLLAELALPGIFLIWLALAAGLMWIVTIFVDLGWQMELVLFAILSVISVLALRPRFVGHDVISDQPHLNQRMFNYVGQSYVLAAPIVNGRGKLKIEDTMWEVEGPDSDAGQKVRVSGVNGMKLKVEKV